jgi:hypothetical protein
MLSNTIVTMVQKRKANDSKPKAKSAKASKKGIELNWNDESAVGSDIDKGEFTKEETKELKDLMKNHLTGKKTVNIKMEHASEGRRLAFEKFEEQGLVKVEKVETFTIKSFVLTEKGVDIAVPHEYKLDMASVPSTDKELHEKIKKWSYHRKTGEKMFDVIRDVTVNGKTISKTDLARELGTESKSPNFFYTLQRLKAQGYVHESDMKTLRLSKNAFVEKKIPFVMTDDGQQKDHPAKETASAN